MTDDQRQPFDLLNSPLEGTNLIEASAGTGKTYTITGLYLRLVLETGFSVNEILVVTFTEAATQELRERIRGALRAAETLFSGHSGEGPFLDGLLKRSRDHGRALTALREALRSFDQAAILTIHGFCRRVLHDNAFESGAFFDATLLPDQEEIKGEIADDFWRSHFYEASPLFVNYALAKGFTTDELRTFLNRVAAHPFLKIIPACDVEDAREEESAFRTAFKELQEAWAAEKAAVEAVLLGHEGLNRRSYGKTRIPLWLRAMDDYTKTGGDTLPLFEGFEKFTTSALEKGVKKGQVPPGLPFFEVCEMVKDRAAVLEKKYQNNLIGLKNRFILYAEEELRLRKERQNLLSFDDLLTGMHGALQGRGGPALSRTIRNRYRAALVDEFQDTDPIQYAIFKEVFSGEGGLLFYIGDPKQAIYSFRGADLFAYMKASGDAESRYTLDRNWRSEPGLIQAVNTVFTHNPRPFVYDQIPFEPVSAAKGDNADALTIDGQKEPPFDLWFINGDEAPGQAQPMSKERAYEVIPKAVASEISRLLDLGRNQRALIGARPLDAGDIAVLVRRNAEAEVLKDALSELNIPSVLYSTGDIFESREAREMERVFLAIAEPGNRRRLMAALSTDLIGMTGEGLDALLRDGDLLESWIIRFREYHALWSERGFILMFRRLMAREKIMRRFMAMGNGERRNTNLLHLAEILQQVSLQKKLTMGGLLKWFSEQRQGAPGSSEEHPLRLESDEHAVKLVTVHKSKGLEYPVLFCPFLWDGSRIRSSEKAFWFHDQGPEQQLTLDLGSQERDHNRPLAEKERLAENCRLFYVALTRAKNRCTLVWGRFRGAETSAPAYLFYPLPQAGPEAVVDSLEERIKGLDKAHFEAGPRNLAERAGGAIRLSPLPEQQGRVLTAAKGQTPRLRARSFSGTIKRGWSVSSFSSLISGHGPGHGSGPGPGLTIGPAGGPANGQIDEMDSRPVDYDALGPSDGSEETVYQDKDPEGTFAFPKGARAGTFMHDLFEHLDFSADDPVSWKGLIREKLGQYGFDPAWEKTLSDMVDRVLSAPLDPDHGDLRLSLIQNQARLNELGFYFPLKRISAEGLKRCFETVDPAFPPATLPERIGRLEFSPVRGFMRGFIDMVFLYKGRFFLVDWKSNFLGPRVEDYAKEGLRQTMEEDFYILQYTIYTLALNQYLALRKPDYDYERDFGGVFYLFLRGVDPMKGPDFGIYRDRPTGAFIRSLKEALIEEA